METKEITPSETEPTETGDAEAIRHLRQAIMSGTNWYVALLESIRLWSSTEEVHDDRTYSYQVGYDAFDGLLLAERLCATTADLIPEDEMVNLLFHARPPINVSKDRFKELIGPVKYGQYLNFFYGITVEQALILAVEEGIRKERFAYGFSDEKDTVNEAYKRIYGTSRDDLLKDFRFQNVLEEQDSITIGEMKQFTYWLFKCRVKFSDKARVASDTKKGLDWLEAHHYPRMR